MLLLLLDVELEADELKWGWGVVGGRGAVVWR